MYEVLSLYAHWSHAHQGSIAKVRVQDKLNLMCERKHTIDTTTLTPATWRIVSSPFLWELIIACDYDKAQGTTKRRSDVIRKYFDGETSERYLDTFGCDHDAHEIWARMERMLGLFQYKKHA